MGRQDTGKELSLKNYLEVHARSPERLLSDRTWTQWKAAAGVAPAPVDPDLAVLGAAVARACQVTAPGYLGAIRDLPASGLSLAGEDAAAANMLYSMLWDTKGEKRGLATRGEAFRWLNANPSILADLREVAAYQMDITQCAGHKPYPLPLELHGHYTNNEIQAAWGRSWDFSATTLYKDYPINLTRMHWESQSGTTQASATGQNLIAHAARGYSIYLFVRLNRTNGPLTAPFQFFGRGSCLNPTGNRPISMVWHLDHPMPAELLEANRVGG